MSRTAPRVHLDQPGIEHLKRLQQALDAELRVTLRMRDGSRLVGTLLDRPTIQQFRGPDGREGTNGQLRIDLGGGDIRDLWPDEVAHYTPMGSS